MSETEFYEDIGQRRQHLKDKSMLALKDIEIDLQELKEDSIRIGKKAAVIGGILLGGYVLYRLLSPTDSTEEEDATRGTNAARSTNAPSVMLPVVRQVSNVALALLLEYARRRLMRYLDSLDEAPEHA
jgi:hypothetical protein